MGHLVTCCKLVYIRVATNLENLENSGNLKHCQNLRENSGKCKICDILANDKDSSEVFSLEFLRKNVENALEISGNLVFQKCGHHVHSPPYLRLILRNLRLESGQKQKGSQ